MDKIYLNDLAFFGYHGALPEENSLGQTYRVSLILETDTSKAGQTDNLSDTIDYRNAINIVRDIITGPSLKLIETLAEKIAENLLQEFTRASSVTVLVSKPRPPVGVELADVAVKIRRSRTK